MNNEKILAFISILLVIALSLILWLAYPEINDKPIRIEFIRALSQFSIALVVSGFLALLVKSADQLREKSRLMSEKREDYLKRLGKIYRTVKAARRTLIAGGLTTRYKEKPEFITDDAFQLYSEQMKQLNEAQLELEGLRIEAEALLRDENISAGLKKMEKYLREILYEYEKFSSDNCKDMSSAFDKLERLNEFTFNTKKEFTLKYNKEKTDYRFKDYLSKPYSSVIKIVIQMNLNKSLQCQKH